VGTLINETYLSDGDVVHFFYDYPGDFIYEQSIKDLAAEYVRAVNPVYSNGTLTVQLQIHDTYITQEEEPKDDQMQVNNYYDLAGFDEEPITGRLLDQDGADTGATMTYDAVTGSAVFTGVSITAGETYIVVTDSVLRHIDDPDWADAINDAYFYLTGAYSKVAVSAS
jgi:hypothetical protein